MTLVCSYIDEGTNKVLERLRQIHIYVGLTCFMELVPGPIVFDSHITKLNELEP
jgi:hypothetical protein